MEWYPIKLSTHVRAYAFGERTFSKRSPHPSILDYHHLMESF